MRVAAALCLLAVVGVGAYLVVAEGGALATTYAVGVVAVVGLLSLRQVAAWLPPPSESARPLCRVALRGRPPQQPRPVALLEWEEALLAARVRGSADRALARRIAPLVEARLCERRGIGSGDPRALELLGPTWARLCRSGPDVGAAGASLDDIDDLTRRLEAL